MCCRIHMHAHRRSVLPRILYFDVVGQNLLVSPPWFAVRTTSCHRTVFFLRAPLVQKYTHLCAGKGLESGQIQKVLLFSLRQNVPTVSGAHPAFIVGGHRGLCPRRRGNEGHLSLPCNSEAKNDCRYASSPPVRLGYVDRGFTLWHLSLHVCASLLS